MVLVEHKELETSILKSNRIWKKVLLIKDFDHPYSKD